MNIKMIVTDLDDTLLRDDKTISEKTAFVLKQCREKGLKISYATGRGGSAKVLVNSDWFDGYVCMNGALAYSGEGLVYSKLMSMESVRDLLAAADKAGIKIAAEAQGWHYANFAVSEVWNYIQNYVLADFKKLDIKAEKIYAIIEKQSDLDLIKNHLSDDLHIYESRDNLAMIMRSQAKKSAAVKALAASFGIGLHEIAAFGDDINDIDLLKQCGIGVAMENALDVVKAVADFICGTNNEDGVAVWLEKNILKTR